MKRLVYVLILMFALYLPAFAPAFADDEPGAALIYGEGYSYVLISPQGWNLDTESGSTQGLLAVLYRNGTSFKDAGALMYTNVVALKAKDAATQIKDEIEAYRKNIPGLKIEEKEKIKTGDGAQGSVFNLTDGKMVFEAVAYIPGEKNIVVIGLTGKTEKDFKSGIKPFEELVSSYIYIDNADAIIASPQEEEEAP